MVKQGGNFGHTFQDDLHVIYSGTTLSVLHGGAVICIYDNVVQGQSNQVQGKLHWHPPFDGQSPEVYCGHMVLHLLQPLWWVKSFQSIDSDDVVQLIMKDGLDALIVESSG